MHSHTFTSWFSWWCICICMFLMISPALNSWGNAGPCFPGVVGVYHKWNLSWIITHPVPATQILHPISHKGPFYFLSTHTLSLTKTIYMETPIMKILLLLNWSLILKLICTSFFSRYYFTFSSLLYVCTSPLGKLRQGSK